MLGKHDGCLGIEWDEAACQTARAAGHQRLQADIAELDPRDFGPIEGLIASPPCQAYSAAGKGLGKLDKPHVIACAHELAAGNDSRAEHLAECRDPRSMLTVEPLRWALELAPRWIACEQVPAVLELWTLFAELLSVHGYHTATGVLTAEQYGVPQTRKRAYLIASLDGPVSLPDPTHERYRKGHPRGQDLTLSPWVSMAEALGWGMTQRPSMTVTSGGAKTGGAEPFGNGARQSMGRERDAGRWALQTTNSASTLAFGHNAPRWVYERPATTLACDPRLTPGDRHLRNPDHQRGDPPTPRTANAGVTVRLEPHEASVLMGFPADYPWQGSKTKQFQQIGNAVCPPVGAAVLSAAMGLRALAVAA